MGSSVVAKEPMCCSHSEEYERVFLREQLSAVDIPSVPRNRVDRNRTDRQEMNTVVAAPFVLDNVDDCIPSPRSKDPLESIHPHGLH